MSSTDRDEPLDTRPLARTLGAPQIVFMVVAMAAPLTVVAGVLPLMIALGNGPGAPLDFAVVGVVLALFAVGFAAITPQVEDAGAFASYVRAGLGRHLGLGAASLAVTTYALLLVAVTAYLGASARSALLSLVGIDLPWWSLSLACLGLVAYLGYRNIEMSARVLGVLLVAEVAVVAVLDLAIVLQGGSDGITATPLGWESFSQGATGTGIMFAVFGFIGFEATAVFRAEAKEPDRTIPRATYAAIGVIAATYIVSAWAVVIGLGADRAVALAQSDPEGLVPGLAQQYVSAVASDAVQVLLATSFLACVLTAHNVVSRYLFDLGRKRALPASLAAIHARHRSPHVASATVSVVVSGSMLATIATGLDPVIEVYAWLGGAGTLGLIVLLALTSVAVLAYFVRHPGQVSPWRGVVAPALAALALLGIAGLVVDKFALLIGSERLAAILLAGLALSFVAGLAWSAHSSRRRPLTA